MDTPFSETTYTEKYMQDQQARTLTDVLAGDPDHCGRACPTATSSMTAS